MRISVEVGAGGGEELFHCGGVTAADYVAELGETAEYVVELRGGVGVEEDLAHEEVVFVHEPAGYLHVALEGGSGGVLVLHHAGERQRGGKGYRQGVGNRQVVLLEGVVDDVEVEFVVEAAEEFASGFVALLYDDCIFAGEIGKGCESGPEHGVGADEGMSASGVESGESGLYGGDVAQYGVGPDMGKHGFKCLEGVFYGGGVDNEIGVEVIDFIEGFETLGVVDKAQALGAEVVDADAVVERKHVAEEPAHFAGSENKNLHGGGNQSWRRTDSSWIAASTRRMKSSLMPIALAAATRDCMMSS